jgi:hypothetical protein
MTHGFMIVLIFSKLEVFGAGSATFLPRRTKYLSSLSRPGSLGRLFFGRCSTSRLFFAQRLRSTLSVVRLAGRIGAAMSWIGVGR